MSIRIALAGNPNSGKTTLFNLLTGSNQYVGNWPGVTVEKKEGKLKGHEDIILVDLPGIYSLSPYTLEEVVTRDYLINEAPEAMINIVDSTNIERNLYLTTQLQELGIPVIIALNMTDLLRKKGDTINIPELKKALGCEIVEISALKGEGCEAVIEKAVAIAKEKRLDVHKQRFSATTEDAIQVIEKLISQQIAARYLRWYSIKLFERDIKVQEALHLDDQIKQTIEAAIVEAETKHDDDSESIITSERYDAIEKVVVKTVHKKSTGKMSLSDRIDQVVTNRILALPIFAMAMFLVYYISITTVGTWATDWVNDVFFGEMIIPNVEQFLVTVGSAEWLNSLILDGIIAGVGGVIGFLPQMMVLFFCLAILEDCGYMSRIAFIMDRIFRHFGLSGKSFIPILIGTGCGVPGIMASRTIENESDRKMTIITTTFIPCSAKLPIIALIAGALFPGSAWVAPSAYFIGMIAIIVSGIMLKKTKSFAGEAAPFVMELPPYHLPNGKNLLRNMWDKAKSFLIKAGTIIFLASGIIWFLSSFNWSLQMVDTGDSILATIGGIIAPIFEPLGWGDWRSTVATITGLVAKENVVGTFGVLYGFNEVAENGQEVWQSLQMAFTPLSGYSFLVFNLLCAPCVAAIGAIKREMGNGKWTLVAVGYQTGFAYVIALIIYQLGLLATGASFTLWTAVAIALLIFMLYRLFMPYKK
ncbi:MAG: ferrous iron transport protein B [Cellulosilyticaceae bacterium]